MSHKRKKSRLDWQESKFKVVFCLQELVNDEGDSLADPWVGSFDAAAMN